MRGFFHRVKGVTRCERGGLHSWRTAHKMPACDNLGGDRRMHASGRRPMGNRRATHMTERPHNVRERCPGCDIESIGGGGAGNTPFAAVSVESRPRPRERRVVWRAAWRRNPGNTPFAADSSGLSPSSREGRVVRQRGAAECLRQAKGMARREIVWPFAAAVEHRAAGEYT